MKTAKKHLLISLAIFAVAFLTVTIYIGANANGAVQTMSAALSESEAPVIEPVQEQPEDSKPSNSRELETPQSAPVAPESLQTYQQPSEAQNAPQAQPQQEMERIPFTSNRVQAGNPESYVGTYGQCPFYENAMEGKGCVPPPDIECNADWSVCEYVGVKND